MGCREWNISGGEPMLRGDFAEIFDYITARSATYSLNTNGTLITPAIARLMRRKGSKMVAIYGATAEVNDHITRTPGSFESVLQGIAYLKEAGAGFVIQIVPMKDNYHQFEEMKALAESLSRHWRIGASWLYLSAYHDTEKMRKSGTTARCKPNCSGWISRICLKAECRVRKATAMIHINLKTTACWPPALPQDVIFTSTHMAI